MNITRHKAPFMNKIVNGTTTEAYSLGGIDPSSGTRTWWMQLRLSTFSIRARSICVISAIAFSSNHSVGMATSKEPSPEVTIATTGCLGCLGIIALILIIGGILAGIEACSSGDGSILWPDESDTETWEYQNQLIRKCWPCV